jgi:hypothetical protein
VIFDELWRLERRLVALQSARSRTLKRLREEQGSQLPFINAHEKAAWEKSIGQTDILRDEIERVKTTRLLKRANRLGLPVPSLTSHPISSDTWKETRIAPGHISYHLSRAAQSELRSRIRLEEKERREAVAFWVKDVLVPMLSVVLGIIGATTGLIAILRK